jgi:hypothetical protein
MCPACIAAAALIATKAASTSGLAGMVVTKFRSNKHRAPISKQKTQQVIEKENGNGDE